MTGSVLDCGDVASEVAAFDDNERQSGESLGALPRTPKAHPAGRRAFF
jgi:hypothetical protein